MQHSLYLQDFLKIMATELSHHPRTACFLIVLPNTPVWGTGGRPSDAAWGPGVADARDSMLEALKTVPGCARKRVVGLYNADTLWGKHRALTVDMALVTSDTTEADPSRGPGVNKPAALFQLSPLWQREAVANLLEANGWCRARSAARC